MPAFLLLLLLLSGAAHGAERTAATIGVLAPDGFAEALHDWTHLGSYLEQALGDTRFHLRFLDLEGLRRAVAGGEVDFVITNSGHYVELEAEFGIHSIATREAPHALSPGEAIASAIFVRRDRQDLQRLEDLAGQRVAAVSETAFGGYQVARLTLHDHGIEPTRDFAALAFYGFPLPDIVRAVADRNMDAGIIRACLLERMDRSGEIQLADFRVLNVPAGDPFPCLRSTQLYPDWPFAALPQTPHAFSKRVATALLMMPLSEDAGGWTVPTDYQAVHGLFRTLQTGPYAYLREPTLAALLHRYRWWLVFALFLVAAWAIHTVRVEHLVHVRTRALDEAMRAREAAERESRTQQEKFDHMARLGILGELSSMIAHELNQPLSAIGNFARGMERRIDSGRIDENALREASQQIAEQADRARAIMQRMRTFTQKRRGSRGVFALAEAVESAVALFASDHRAATVFQHLDPTARVYADRLQIEQVLLNLLKNGLDAMEGLAPTERRLEIAVQREGAACRVCIADCGSGLDEASRQRLFEPFFTTKPEGMGLGLTICKRIVEAHGGRLWAEANSNGRGLKVCFSLPTHEEGT